MPLVGTRHPILSTRRHGCPASDGWLPRLIHCRRCVRAGPLLAGTGLQPLRGTGSGCRHDRPSPLGSRPPASRPTTSTRRTRTGLGQVMDLLDQLVELLGPRDYPRRFPGRALTRPGGFDPRLAPPPWIRSSSARSIAHACLMSRSSSSLVWWKPSFRRSLTRPRSSPMPIGSPAAAAA